MECIETKVFTRQVSNLLDDDEYRFLQLSLILNPAMGPKIPGGGGIRKVRWGLEDRGKRSGARVIYFWATSLEQIFMLLIYSKAEKDDLSPDQLKILRRIVEEELL